MSNDKTITIKLTELDFNLLMMAIDTACVSTGLFKTMSTKVFCIGGELGEKNIGGADQFIGQIRGVASRMTQEAAKGFKSDSGLVGMDGNKY